MSGPSTNSELLFHFMKHILYASLLFVMIAAVATGLWYLTSFMEKLGVPKEIAFVCHWTANILFGVDIFCLAFFVAGEAWKLIREVIADLRS